MCIRDRPNNKRLEAPDQPLIPAAGVFLTILGAGIGFLTWSLPISVLSSMGMGKYWIFVEIIASIFLVYHGISMLLRGKIMEIEKISKFSHALLGENYKIWWGEKRFSSDIYLGLWLAWLIWLLDPSLVAQGVGAMARSGQIWALASPLMLIGFSIAGGVSILLMRTLVLLFGQISTMLGLMSVGVRPRAWGLVMGIMGSWTLITLILGPIYSTI